MHAAMYNDKHQFFGVTSMPTRKNRTFQKGLREYLLCADCEQQLGRYEAYARKVFFGSADILVHPRHMTLELQNVEYAPLKLFFISLLWRFGVTSIPEYHGARLGPHEERLRRMLSSESPGAELDYPCVVTAVTLDGVQLSDLMFPPTLSRVDAHSIWNLVVAGFLLTFYVSSHRPPEVLYPVFLKPIGTMIVRIQDIKEITFLHSAMCHIADAERRRRGE